MFTNSNVNTIPFSQDLVIFLFDELLNIWVYIYLVISVILKKVLIFLQQN